MKSEAVFKYTLQPTAELKSLIAQASDRISSDKARVDLKMRLHAKEAGVQHIVHINSNLRNKYICEIGKRESSNRYTARIRAEYGDEWI